MGAMLLRVNLSNGKICKETIAEALVRQFIGGSGVATKLLADAAEAGGAGVGVSFATPIELTGLTFVGDRGRHVVESI